MNLNSFFADFKICRFSRFHCMHLYKPRFCNGVHLCCCPNLSAKLTWEHCSRVRIHEKLQIKHFLHLCVPSPLLDR